MIVLFQLGNEFLFKITSTISSKVTAGNGFDNSIIVLCSLHKFFTDYFGLPLTFKELGSVILVLP